MKNCSGCKFAVFQDYGYSNWTVEGTTFRCSPKLHPNGEFDRFYGEDDRLTYAEQCYNYTEGEPVRMDVDHEEYALLSEEQRAIYDASRE